MTKPSTHEKLYQKHLRAMRKAPLDINEPSSGGIHPATFFAAIAGMGERARQNGTIALSVRTRKKPPD